MAIHPTKNDIGRRVKLPVFGGQPQIGTLTEMLTERGPSGLIDEFAMVLYPGAAFAVATDPTRLEWVE